MRPAAAEARRPADRDLTAHRGAQFTRARPRRVRGRRTIPKGTRIVEYLGDRMSHEAADARYEDHDENDNHTFLFIVDKHTVIDAASAATTRASSITSARATANPSSRTAACSSTRRATSRPAQELGYDYEIGRDKDDPPNVDEIYACRCGSPQCRGTMLWPPRKESTEAKAKNATAPKTAPKTRKSRRPEAKRRAERSRRRA